MSEKRSAYEVHTRHDGIQDEAGRSVTKEIGPWIKLSTEFRERHLAELKGAPLAVFLCLALHIGEDYLAWPSVEVIAKETAYDRRTVSRALAKLANMELIVIERRRGEGQEFANNRYQVKAFAGYGRSNPRDKMPQGSDPGDISTESGGHLPAVAHCPAKKNQPSKKNHKMIQNQSQKRSSSGITEFLLDHSPNVSSPKNPGIIEAEKNLSEVSATLEDCEDAEINGFLMPHILVPTNAEIVDPWPAQIAGGVMEWLKLKRGEDEFWV